MVGEQTTERLAAAIETHRKEVSRLAQAISSLDSQVMELCWRVEELVGALTGTGTGAA